ncbi:MAG: hypothetical protein U0798_20880 [Gemmataceae bacterium]
MPPVQQRYQPRRYEEDESDGVSIRRRIVKWLIILLIPLILWQAWRMVSSSRQLAKVRTLQGQMAQAKDLKPEERQALFKDMRTAMNNLSPAQKKLLSSERQAKQIQELKNYVALSKAEQRKYLDSRINMMQQMTRANQGAGPMGPSGGRNGMGSANGPGGSGGQRSPEQIEHAKRERLDHSSPEFRALNDRFRNDLTQRMRERGISPPPGRGG